MKVSQLLLAGDVESNPRPGNYTEIPKEEGKPKMTTRLWKTEGPGFYFGC